MTFVTQEYDNLPLRILGLHGTIGYKLRDRNGVDMEQTIGTFCRPENADAIIEAAKNPQSGIRIWNFSVEKISWCSARITGTCSMPLSQAKQRDARVVLNTIQFMIERR